MGVVPPLNCQSCDIDEHCVGERWAPDNCNELAKLVAIVLMGQASRASEILNSLDPACPVFSPKSLREEAKIKLTVDESTDKPKKGYPQSQRDGLIFEIISWIAAKTTYHKDALLKDPHVSATTQGLDGFLIELDSTGNKIKSTSLFEDKCTTKPRQKFLSEVMPTFRNHHKNLRSAEIISTAAALLRIAGFDDKEAAQLSADVTDLKKRRYRAAFSLPRIDDTLEKRKTLFAGYKSLTGINPRQRIGASFVTPSEMRAWFNQIASDAIQYLESLEDGID